MTKFLLILMMVGVWSGCGYLIKTHTEKYDNGKWVEYYESGEVKKEGNYVDGKKEGKWVEYYENGKVWVEGNFVNGKKVGKWVEYDESGKVKDEDIYKDGECVEMCEGYE